MLVSVLTFAQKQDGPTPVTPAIEKKINTEIDKELPAFLVRLEKETQERTDKFDESVKFCTDTFKIESYFRKYTNYDYSTAGITSACYDAAAKYDALLNKYYKLLSAKLKPKDKAVLLAAQRNWLAYRDSEHKLVGILGKDEYSGGGTKENIIYADNYLTLIKERVLKLWEYYSDLYN